MNARTAEESLLGVHHGMPIAVYHASLGLSHSGMCELERSPHHFYRRMLDPARPQRVEKPGQLEGSLAHCATLEPDDFDARYAVGPDCRRGTKAWDAWVAGETRETIKPEQRAVAFAQAAAVRALPDVAHLLSAGRPEVSAFWPDPATGVLLRCRPDWVHPVNDRQVLLLDLKTCASAEPGEFARQIARKNYHAQAAFYSEGYAIAAGVEVLAFIFVPVESTPPYTASACMLDDEGMEAGRHRFRRLVNLYAQCQSTGRWPGFSGVNLVSLPQWARDHDEETI